MKPSSNLLLKAAMCLVPRSHLAFHPHNSFPSASTTHQHPPSAICNSARYTFPVNRELKRRRGNTAAALLSGPTDKHQQQQQQQQQDATVNPLLAWEDSMMPFLERDTQGKIMLKGLRFSELEQLVTSALGEKPGRAEILCGWLYHSGRLIRDVNEAEGDDSDSGYRMGWVTRGNIRSCATADGGLRLEGVQLAADGTRKMVSVLTSGEGVGKRVETVIIPMLKGPQMEPRYTICVSSQVGCAMNCQFCYTGRLGLMANLQTAQMVEQVIGAKRYLESIGDPAPVTGAVFMGMGEPFDNYDRVMRAVKILTDSRAGVRLKASRVTVSTVGLVPEIERFCTDPRNGASLAISLHAVTDEVRDKLIPVNRRYPLAQLSATLRTHFPRRGYQSADRSGTHSTEERSSEQSQEYSRSETAADASGGQYYPSGPSSPTAARFNGNTESQTDRTEIQPTQQQQLSAPREVQAVTSPLPTHQQQPRESKLMGDDTHLGPGRRGVRGQGQGRRTRGRNKCRILAVEYTLIGGVNDSLEDAERLARWLHGVACVVNLITFNSHEGTPFVPSSLSTSREFREALLKRGQLCTYRDSRGDDGMAACGQLGGESMDEKRTRKPVPVTWTPPSTALPQ